MRRIGLTGGIGSGKSTVARVLGTLGAVLIDADAISRARPLPAARQSSRSAPQFGAPFIDANGALDRDRMRALVFEDGSARARLEAIVHPLVGAEIARADCSRARCRRALRRVRHSAAGRVRRTLGRAGRCGLGLRLLERRPRSRASCSATACRAPRCESIIASQATREQRLAAADVVIYNDGVSLEQLAQTVTQAAESFGL